MLSLAYMCVSPVKPVCSMSGPYSHYEVQQLEVNLVLLYRNPLETVFSLPLQCPEFTITQLHRMLLI